MRTVLLALAAFAGFTLAAPISSLEVRAAVCSKISSNDVGTFSLPCSTYASALTCPNGLNRAKNGVVLLVHGTGSTGIETWGNGPYLELLPKAGFDVCYVDLPSRALVDIQTSSEYVAYLIHVLARRSINGKVGIVTHSQGGLNAQWALDFWPATRSLTSSFVALAPPFHGTAEGPPACLVVGLLTGGCNPSVIQQSVGSNFLGAINAKGNVALVPTTSVYTAYDDVIQPELIAPTSRLNGAEVVRLQDQCGAAYVVEHFTIPFSSYAYYLAVDALTNKRVADTSTVLKSSCAWILSDDLLAEFNRGPAILREAVNDALAVITGPKATKEPLLRQYVCQRGDLSTGCSSS